MPTVNFQNDTLTHRTSGMFLLFQKKIQIYPPVQVNWTVQIITGYSLNLHVNVCLPIHWLNIIFYDYTEYVYMLCIKHMEF